MHHLALVLLVDTKVAQAQASSSGEMVGTVVIDSFDSSVHPRGGSR